MHNERLMTMRVKMIEKTRAGFRGGGQDPRPPTNRGPPTKPFNFYFALTIGLWDIR